MDILTFEKITPYVPYDLKVLRSGNIISQFSWCSEIVTRNDGHILNIKPILKPLSDLKNWQSVDSKTIQIQLIELENDVSLLSYQLFEVLLENHFDVFDLIPNNLAIDINTL